MQVAAVRDRLAAFPKVALAHLPTPLDLLRDLYAGHRIFVKRDDCTGFALGGNKSRKLEYTIGDAQSHGATALITASGVQSNHVRQSAAAAARYGMSFHGIVTPALERFPRAHLDSGNLLLDSLFGATLHLARADEDVDARVEALRKDLVDKGERPYVIPLGASDGIGSLGYVQCACELIEQSEAAGLDLSHVFVPTGSGGTHAGLLAGLRLAGSRAQVVGISVSEPAPVKRDRVRTSLQGLQTVLGCALPLSDNEIVVHDAYTGAGYAHPTADGNRWIGQLARHEGLLLDQVYTAKAFSGMEDLLARGAVVPSGDIVFLHTGGTAALFADPRLLVRVEDNAPALTPLYEDVDD